MAAPGPGQGLTEMLVMFGLMFAIFYFLVIRPQRAKELERQALLGRLKKNDRVLTQGGMYGIVTHVQDNEVTLKVDLEKNVRVRVARSAVVDILGEEGGGGDDKDKDAKKPS